MLHLDNYFRLKNEIVCCATKEGRNPEDITVIVISKKRPLSPLISLYYKGCRDFGENRIDEALLKIIELPQDVNCHFIGHIQTKKTKNIVGNFALIHSVDSVKLAKNISKYSIKQNVITNILLQVNTSEEKTKRGFSSSECLDYFEELKSLPNLNIKGLMTIAPFTNDKNCIRRCFSDLRELRDKLKLEHLSMGMSNDYKIAIAEGATMLRIGSKIFECL